MKKIICQVRHCKIERILLKKNKIRFTEQKTKCCIVVHVFVKTYICICNKKKAARLGIILTFRLYTPNCLK